MSQDIRTAYGSKSTLTTTNLTSLGNNNGWQSATIDLDTTKFLDLIFRIQTKGQASGTSVLEVYVAPSLNADTTYPDGASGSEGSFTAANRLNAILWDTIQMNTTSAVIKELRSLAALLGFLPQKLTIIIINKSGAALSTTAGDHILDVQPVYATAA